MTSALVQRVKTGSLAVVFAGMVWLYAEGESLATRAVDVGVTFPVDSGAELVIIPDDADFHGSARVRLEATARSLDDSAAAVGSNLAIKPGTPGVPTKAGEKQVVDLREVLGALPALKGLGSSVNDVQPQRINVNVVRMVKRELPVVVELGAGAGDLVVDGDPTVSPASVSVRLPEALAAKLPEGAAMIAPVSETDLRRLRTDGPQSIMVALRPPAEIVNAQTGVGENGVRTPRAVVTPAEATVTLRLRSRVDTMTLGTVPVWFSLPPTEDAGKWTITVVDKFLSDIPVIGPAEEIRRLVPGGASGSPGGSGGEGVKATIELTSDDLAKALATAGSGPSGGTITKAVVFSGLPPGVTVTRPGVTARVRVSPRSP